MSRVKGSVDRRQQSRFRRVPQIERLEDRAAAGDLLVGLGSAAVASQGSLALAENAADEAFRQQGFRSDTEFLDRWIAGEEAQPRSLVATRATRSEVLLRNALSGSSASQFAKQSFAEAGSQAELGNQADEDELAPDAQSGFGLPKIIKELRDGGLSPQPEEDFFDDFDGIFPLNLAPPATGDSSASNSATGSAGAAGASEGSNSLATSGSEAPSGPSPGSFSPQSTGSFSPQPTSSFSPEPTARTGVQTAAGDGANPAAGQSAAAAAAVATSRAAPGGVAATAVTDGGSAPAAASNGRPFASGGGPKGDVWTGPVARGPGASAAEGKRGGPKAQGMADPTWVIDWNNGLTLSEGAISYQSKGASMDLRAQVQAAAVASYAWDLSAAPDAENVSGADTYRLRFNWGTSLYGSYRDNQIQLTVAHTDYSQTVFTYGFRVTDHLAPGGGYSGGGSGGSGGGGGPVSVVRPEVITPDLIGATRDAISGDAFAMAPATGELTTGYTAASYNRLAPPIGLGYNSEAAAPQPIFLDRYELNPASGTPNTVSAKLTFNGAAGQEYYYDTTGLNPGDIMEIALQGDASSLATGRYGWQIDVTAHYQSGDVTSYNTGTISVVNYATSTAGAGWSINGLTRLYAQSDGALLDLGDGHSLWFAWDAQTQSYATPAGDFSTLVKNPDNTFTRTLKTGEQIRFDTVGKQTAFVDLNGNTVSYAYDQNGNLATITDQNNLATSFAYAGGWLSTITDPAGRVSSFAHNGNGRLTGVTQPDNTTWGFDYDSVGHITSRTDPRGNVTGFNYSFGRLSGVSRPDATSIALSAYQLQGLLAPGGGTPGYPATPVLLAGAMAAYTDGRSETWQTYSDWSGFGAQTGFVDAAGNLAVTVPDANGLPTMQTDQLSRNSFFDRDSKGNVTAAMHPDFQTDSYAYNALSRVTQYTDAGGKVYAYSYDAQGNLTQATNPLLKSKSYTYTTQGLVATATDELGRVTSFTYDTRQQPTQITLPGGATQQFTWDTAGNMTSATDPNGNVTNYAYNTMGQVTQITLPGTGNPTIGYIYDSRGNLVSETDPLSHTTTYAYDAMNRRTSATDPLNHATTYAYDAEGNITSTTDALGRTFTGSYNAVGDLVAVVDPLAQQTSLTVDAVSQVTAMTDPLSNTTSYGYNARGWDTQTISPQGIWILKSYTPQGWLTWVSESGGGGASSISYTYDDLGRKTSFINQVSGLTNYAYDDVGNLVSQTNPLGKTTTWAYDARNRLTSESDPLSHATSFGYDAVGNRTSVTDALNRTTSYQFDAQHRLTRTTDPAIGQTNYAYDLAGRLTSVTDAVGNVTSYGYDAANRKTSQTDPLGRVTSYAFDAANELTGVTDRNARQRTFSYDTSGRRTAENWLDGQGATIRTIAYGYDYASRLTSTSDPSAAYAFAYDSDGRVTSVDNAGTPGMPNVALTFAYDAHSNRTSLTDNLGGQLTYTYDAANRMTSAEMAVTGINAQPRVTFGYDAASRLTSLSRQDAVSGGGGSGGSGGGGGGSVAVDTSIAYDDASRITGITHAAGSSTLANYALTWDAANQLGQEISNDGTVNYSYDLTGQLTAATGWRTESYSFDATGNRTMSGYQTGTGNRLVSDGSFNYTYDLEGNMLTKTELSTGKVTEYAWDHRNRLTSVTQKDSVGTVIQQSNYTYDPFDKRIGVSFDPDGAGPQPAAQTWTAYDGLNPYADFNGSGNLTQRYLYGPAVDQILGRLDPAGNIAWHLTDHLGSVRDLADTSGAVIDHIQYNSFGQVLSESNPAAGDRFKFTGRELDPNDLYYYRARYYDSAVGRFLSEDPLGFDAGDTNLQRYCSNAPTTRTDPSGMWSWEWPIYYKAGWSQQVLADGTIIITYTIWSEEGFIWTTKTIIQTLKVQIPPGDNNKKEIWDAKVMDLVKSMQTAWNKKQLADALDESANIAVMIEISLIFKAADKVIMNPPPDDWKPPDDKWEPPVKPPPDPGNIVVPPEPPPIKVPDGPIIVNPV